MLNTASTTALVTNGFRDLSIATLAICASVLTIGVGLLVFYWGYAQIRYGSISGDWSWFKARRSSKK